MEDWRKKFWEAEGLSFTCTRCGNCCRRPGDVLLLPHEADAIAERLRGPGADHHTLNGVLWQPEDDGRLRISVPEEEACPLLGPHGCTVHDIKPIQCATYPFWPEILRTRRVWESERPHCEGIDLGPRHYAPAEIKKIMTERERTMESFDSVEVDVPPTRPT